MQVEPVIDVAVLPKVFSRPSRLRCVGGWNEAATAAFLAGGFDCLELSCSPKQAINIPLLGQAAKSLKEAELRIAGRLGGFEQFESIGALTLPSGLPRGLVLSDYPSLRELVLQCSGTAGRLPVGCAGLERLGIVSWEGGDASGLSQLQCLQSLAISQGRIKTLRGIGRLPDLRSLNLAYVRFFSDIESVARLSQLASLDIENAPALAGILPVSKFASLRSLRVVSSALTVDLGGLERNNVLEVLWLNGRHMNLEWPELLSLPSLRIVAIPVGEEALALKKELETAIVSSGRSVQKLEIVGSKRAGILEMVLA